MALSPEYPDLAWMPPKSWTNANRSSVQLIVIHTTEGSEGPSSAEDGAAYDQRRTDGTSTHFFHDQDSTVQCVRTEDVAHTARHQGNLRGVQHELCGRAGQGGTGWADAASQGTLRQAAKQCARDAKKWGVPVRKLSVAQVADGVKGFCGHVDITYAFPQDNGTHTDPGPTFPWSQFLGMVQAELEDDVLDSADIDKIKSAILGDGGVQQLLSRVEALPADIAAIKPAILGDGGMQNLFIRVEALYSGRDPSTSGANVTHQKLNALAAAVANVDEEVWAKVSDPATPDEVVAAALEELLGDRKDRILALMQPQV